jgi:hypothetical protein
MVCKKLVDAREFAQELEIPVLFENRCGPCQKKELVVQI